MTAARSLAPAPPSEPIVIAARFCGPPGTGNGGYVAGRLASLVPGAGPVEVTLRSPAPLEVDLRARRRPEAGRAAWTLVDPAGDCIAVAVPHSAPLDELPPAQPSAREIATLPPPDTAQHPFPGCFVCGPARAAGDGLHIHPAAVPGLPLAAALWIPGAELAGPGGFVEPAFVWAALDCPGYFGALHGAARVPLLLGRMRAAITGPVRAGARLRVLGWPLGAAGRRHEAATALLDEAGRIVARSRQVWIAPRAPAP